MFRYVSSCDMSRRVWCPSPLTDPWPLAAASGVPAPMVSVTVVRTASLSIYQRSKHVYSDWIRRTFGFDVMAHVKTKGTYPNLYSVACFGAAGATAGSCISIMACPFEFTKLSAQVSVLMADRKNHCEAQRKVADSYLNKGTLKTMANIVHHRGFTGLYTGFRLHLRGLPRNRLLTQ